jgi:hypothetical protein
MAGGTATVYVSDMDRAAGSGLRMQTRLERGIRLDSPSR